MNGNKRFWTKFLAVLEWEIFPLTVLEQVFICLTRLNGEKKIQKPLKINWRSEERTEISPERFSEKVESRSCLSNPSKYSQCQEDVEICQMVVFLAG
jgi:hypothetical protein